MPPAYRRQDLLRLCVLDLCGGEYARPKCRVSFQGGERSPFFVADQFEVMKEQSPHIYKIGSAMPKCSHAMMMEDPTLSVQKILEDLAEMPVYAKQARAANSSRP